MLTEVQSAVVEALREAGNLAVDEKVEPGVNLLDDGYLDSMAFVNMIVRLESRFGVKFSDTDIARKDALSVSGLVSIIMRHKEK